MQQEVRHSLDPKYADLAAGPEKGKRGGGQTLMIKRKAAVDESSAAEVGSREEPPPPIQSGLSVEIQNVSQSFARRGGTVNVLKSISFSIPAGQFVSIVGPSGCGKTTLLHLCCGLEPVQSGQIVIGGESGPVVGRQGTVYVPAQPALLAWRTAIRNVELGLEMVVPDKQERRARAAWALGMVGLSDFEHAFRAQLSQGMRQRVGLARAVARMPELYFMDEPFAALDAQTRLVLQAELLHLLEVRPATTFFVTHDLGEAVSLADRVIVMSARQGRIVGDFPIDLPRPRDPLALQADPEFARIRADLWTTLRNEIEAAQREGVAPLGSVQT